MQKVLSSVRSPRALYCGRSLPGRRPRADERGAFPEQASLPVHVFWLGSLNSAGWLMLVFATLGLVALRGKFPWLVQFPPEYIVPVDQWTNVAVQAVIADLKPLMRTFSDRIADVLNQIRGFFIWLPWSTFVVVIATLGAVAGGWRLAALALGCLLYIAFAGFWTATMATLAALVIIVPLSIVLGFSLGSWRRWTSCRRSPLFPIFFHFSSCLVPARRLAFWQV